MIPLFQFSQNMYYIHIQWYLIPNNVDFKYSFAFYFQYVTSLVTQVSSVLCAPAAHRSWNSARTAAQSLWPSETQKR